MGISEECSTRTNIMTKTLIIPSLLVVLTEVTIIFDALIRFHSVKWQPVVKYSEKVTAAASTNLSTHFWRRNHKPVTTFCEAEHSIIIIISLFLLSVFRYRIVEMRQYMLKSDILLRNLLRLHWCNLMLTGGQKNFSSIGPIFFSNVSVIIFHLDRTCKHRLMVSPWSILQLNLGKMKVGI